MMKTEYIRNLNCNYERILLEKKPDESRYQYCMMSRGGIKGLLSCSLRYINDSAYLYYDISSMQNVAQLYSDKLITRSWMKNFLGSMQQVHLELRRFLLDDRNIIWHPEHMFQDLEKSDFFFLYIPYYEGECGFLKLIEYWVEHIDYEDEVLVEYIYKMHEQFELLGTIYLQEQIFEDAEVLNQPNPLVSIFSEEVIASKSSDANGEIDNSSYSEAKSEINTEKKGLLYLLESRRKKHKEERTRFQQDTKKLLEEFAVCEEPAYESVDYGKTIYIENIEKEESGIHRIYTKEGEAIAELTKTPFIIGKKKEEVDCVFTDHSVSRIHARITEENNCYYLEDLNSTNGTFKNGLRLKPYEKKPLQCEDEVRLGKVIFIYR